MADKKEYSSDKIKSLLETAIKKLQERDSIFLDPKFDINERTVTHRLGMYLAELFPDWDVDCEYNRMVDEETMKFVKKQIDVPTENNISWEDTEAKTVFPDIIVHRRTKENNLLSVEVKMGWKNSKGNIDERKAIGYKKSLGYEYSAFVVIGPEKKLEITWME